MKDPLECKCVKVNPSVGNGFFVFQMITALWLQQVTQSICILVFTFWAFQEAAAYPGSEGLSETDE